MFFTSMKKIHGLKLFPFNWFSCFIMCMIRAEAEAAGREPHQFTKNAEASEHCTERPETVIWMSFYSNGTVAVF
jgi:hypothetical protein